MLKLEVMLLRHIILTPKWWFRLFSAFLLVQGLTVYGLSPAPWNFEVAYESSENIFIAEVVEVEKSIEVVTNQVAEDPQTGDKVRLVWIDWFRGVKIALVLKAVWSRAGTNADPSDATILI